MVYKGSLEKVIPLEVRVLDEHAMVVFFEDSDSPGMGHGLTVIDGKGHVAYSVTSDELLGESFPVVGPVDTNGLWWWTGWWVDERSSSVSFVLADDRIHSVSLSQGAHVTLGADAVARGTGSLLVSERKAAWEAARVLRCGEVKSAARAVSIDSKEDRGVRLRAWVAAATLGATAGPGEDSGGKLFHEVLKSSSVPDVNYAFRFARSILGDSGRDFLFTALKDPDLKLYEDAASCGLAAYGEQARRRILRDACDRTEPEAYRVRCIWAFGYMKSPRGFMEVGGLVADDSGSISRAALWAITEVDEIMAVPFVVSALQSKRGDAQNMILWLTAHPNKAGIDALGECLREAVTGKKDVSVSACVEALKECSGEDFGGNPEPWLNWLNAW